MFNKKLFNVHLDSLKRFFTMPFMQLYKHHLIEVLISKNALVCIHCGVELTKQIVDEVFHIQHT